MELEVNRPDVVAEVRAAYDKYEAALMANDVEAMNDLFWHSSHTIRYGVRENLYGHAAIAAYRSGSGGAPQRTLSRVVVTTFGTEFATVNLEFQRQGGGPSGRQSQSWVRRRDGWRIVSAHVSLMPE